MNILNCCRDCDYSFSPIELDDNNRCDDCRVNRGGSAALNSTEFTPPALQSKADISGDPRRSGHGGAERGVILEAVVRRIALKEQEISAALGEIPLWDGFQCYYEGLELKARKEMCGELIEDLKSYIPSLFTPKEVEESGADAPSGARSQRSGGRNAEDSRS